MSEHEGSCRVIQIGDGVPTAFAAKLLADLGFDVIHIEDIGSSMSLREYGVAKRQDNAWNRSPVFDYASAGKRSVGILLEAPRGRALVMQILASADIALLDGDALGGLGGRGFADHLIQTHPQLVVVASTRYGLEGLKSHWVGTDLTSFFSGGEGDTLGAGLNQQSDPKRPPVALPEFTTDYMDGINIAVAALAALRVTCQGNGGQIVDVSSQDAQLSLNHLVPMRFVDGELETRHTRHFSYGGVFECADGFVEILPLENPQWDGLKEIMGQPQWASVDEFATGRGRATHGDRINAAIQAWAGPQMRAELTRLGQSAGCPIAPFLSPEEVVADAHVISRNALVAVEGSAGRRLVPRNALADHIMNRQTESVRVPERGQDTARVLVDTCGLDDVGIRALVAQGVLAVAAEVNR